MIRGGAKRHPNIYRSQECNKVAEGDSSRKNWCKICRGAKPPSEVVIYFTTNKVAGKIGANIFNHLTKVMVAGKSGAKFLLKYLTHFCVRAAGKIGADLFDHLSKSHLGHDSRKIWCKIHTQIPKCQFGQSSRKNWCKS